MWNKGQSEKFPVIEVDPVDTVDPANPYDSVNFKKLIY